MEDAQQRLEALDLVLHRPELAIICRQCGYALQPSGETVSRHLAQKHQVSITARRGLTALIRSLNLPDPNELPVRRDGCLPQNPGAVCNTLVSLSILTSIDPWINSS